MFGSRNQKIEKVKILEVKNGKCTYIFGNSNITTKIDAEYMLRHLNGYHSVLCDVHRDTILGLIGKKNGDN